MMTQYYRQEHYRNTGDHKEFIIADFVKDSLTLSLSHAKQHPAQYSKLLDPPPIHTTNTLQVYIM